MRKVHAALILLIALSAAGAFSETKNLPQGYGDINWGTPLEDALKVIRGKLTYTDNKKVIISRDGDIQYQYGFFYREPEKVKGSGPSTPAPAPASTGAAPASSPGESGADYRPRLFFAAVSFPYMTLESVMTIMKEKYGEPTGETLKDNRGSIQWDSDKTLIVLWVDNYEKKPYCRRITYISKEIAVQVTDYQNRIFNSREIEILKNLKP